MFNVLITDDEPTIREGLRTLIDWEGLGYAVMDTAANGKDALRKITTHRPDLLIVDIRMPGMSGLELIEAVRKTDDEVHVLILSGYADFDYAKKAIGLNIDGYLLKPVDEDELTAHLSKLAGIMERERQAKLASGSMQEWNRQKLLQALVSADLAQRDAPSPSDLEAAGLCWDSYSIAIVKLKGKDRALEPGQFEAIRDRFVTAYDETGRGVVLAVDAALVLLLPDRLQEEQVRRRVYNELASLVTEPGVHIAAVGGSTVTQLGDIRQSYLEAARLLERRFFYTGGQLVLAGTAPFHLPAAISPSAADCTVDVPALADKLYFAIDVGNAEAVAQLIGSTGRRLIDCGQTEEAVKSTFAGLVTAVAGKLSQSGDERKLDHDRLSRCMLAIYDHIRYDELERELTAILPALLIGSAACSGDKQIKKMIDLIQRSYDENLKLETLAEVFNYNSAYLGKLFKSETGEYFNTYLDKVRIEKAKEFLEQGLKVYQVAEKVGYANADYFHAKFRKYVGESPSAYKKK
ncbi:response regulator transcription factor [Paenibacillus sacheonensis]|uniref:Response regulator n=1 Tax=Paenibacillus sacheonensis TaxID=742054 RepID=A0A7X5BWQ0_9BACL|nr:response regulator transcription factor [Paenibacillus sacheonensis]MBM7564154.1 two-component system response regulator YesN [Paenibacillus sacheonensis]NBC67516.1 response regulator [Paenibacillus sacheonensis]